MLTGLAPGLLAGPTDNVISYVELHSIPFISLSMGFFSARLNSFQLPTWRQETQNKYLSREDFGGSIPTTMKKASKRIVELNFEQIMKRFNPTLYKLVGHKPVQCKNFEEWCSAHEAAAKATGKKSGEGLRVAWDEIGGVKVSTVFLGIDHKWSGKGKPVLFETLVFGGKLDQAQQRYTTWRAAAEGHKAMVVTVKLSQKKTSKGK